MNKLPEDFDIKKTILYKDFLIRVKKIGNKELELNLERELRIAYEGYEDSWDWNWQLNVLNAFDWVATPQKKQFWRDIYRDICPVEYED